MKWLCPCVIKVYDLQKLLKNLCKPNRKSTLVISSLPINSFSGSTDLRYIFLKKSLYYLLACLWSAYGWRTHVQLGTQTQCYWGGSRATWSWSCGIPGSCAALTPPDTTTPTADNHPAPLSVSPCEKKLNLSMAIDRCSYSEYTAIFRSTIIFFNNGLEMSVFLLKWVKSIKSHSWITKQT